MLPELSDFQQLRAADMMHGDVVIIKRIKLLWVIEAAAGKMLSERPDPSFNYMPVFGTQRRAVLVARSLGTHSWQIARLR